MAAAQTVDVARIIDDRKMDGFMWSLLIWSFFIITFDGYDISAIGFAGPLVIKAWNAYRNGDELRLLRFKPGGANPEKFPMPH